MIGDCTSWNRYRRAFRTLEGGQFPPRPHQVYSRALKVLEGLGGDTATASENGSKKEENGCDAREVFHGHRRVCKGRCVSLTLVPDPAIEYLIEEVSCLGAHCKDWAHNISYTER